MTTTTWGPATLHLGDCVEVMRQMPAESVHCVLTDPPYGLNFMAHEWDAPWHEARGEDVEHASAWPAHSAPPPTLAQMQGFQRWTTTWAIEALRVLKPGGHLLAFAGARTYHRMVTGLEEAGFEVRDLLAWIQAQGFAKSMNVSRVVGEKHGVTHPAVAQWEGWGTQLRPSIEPIVLARRPVTTTLVDSVLTHGTGAIHIDAVRTAFASEADRAESEGKNQHADYGTAPGGNKVYGDYTMVERTNYDGSKGRWPANVLLGHSGPEEYRILRDDAPEAVRTYYRSQQAVREVWDSDQGDALGDRPSEILQSGVRERGPEGRAEDSVGEDGLSGVRGDLRDLSGVGQERQAQILLEGMPPEGPSSGEPDGQATHRRIQSEDGRQSNDAGAVLAMEGRVLPERWLPIHHDRPTANGDTGAGSADGEGRLHRGASSGGGTGGRTSTGERRGGAPRQRREGGQQAGEPDRGAEGESLHGASGDRTSVPVDDGRVGSTPGGERRVAVPVGLIPPGWERYFGDVVHSAECTDLACATGCAVAVLDEQSGPSTSRVGKPRSGRRGEGWGMTATGAEYDDAGGASRFFPAFRYEPKTPSREKPPGGVWHPTVKPLGIVEWLARGFTAPGQVILDPFAGSGTTGEAVLRVGGGRSVVMVEREPGYARLIAARMKRQVYDLTPERVTESQDAGLLF